MDAAPPSLLPSFAAPWPGQDPLAARPAAIANGGFADALARIAGAGGTGLAGEVPVAGDAAEDGATPADPAADPAPVLAEPAPPVIELPPVLPGLPGFAAQNDGEGAPTAPAAGDRSGGALPSPTPLVGAAAMRGQPAAPAMPVTERVATEPGPPGTAAATEPPPVPGADR
ncbi:MAG: hypothetical protein AAGC69_16440, partial [Paracraurococcus sp.]